jgi:trk system potassium uptake protein TrkH
MNHRRATIGGGLEPAWLAGVMNVVLALTALAAVAALLLEYGGLALREDHRKALHLADTVIVAIFVLDRLLRFLLASDRRQYLHENWIDFALMVLAAVIIAASFKFYRKIISAGTLYVLVTQGYILLTLVIRGLTVNLRFAGSGVHPCWLLTGSFVFLCLAGAGLLMLPVSTPRGGRAIDFYDALFTSTSAVCVTGLTVRQTGSEFTSFGQAVILVLIQLGGLGVMVFGTMLALLVGKGLSLRGSSAVGQMVSSDNVGSMRRIVLFIMAATFALEALGASLLYPMFANWQGGQVRLSAGKAAWFSAFHGISAFCNAGLSVCDQNMMEGVRSGWARPLRNHWQVLGVMAPLIVLGGLGFPVLLDGVGCLRAWLRRAVGFLWGLLGRQAARAPRARLPLHSRIVVVATTVLIFGGAAGLLLVEPPNDRSRYGDIGRTPVYDEKTRSRRDWPRMEPGEKIQAALFQSISARTAGFNTIDPAELSNAGKLWMCWLMIIGGSPAGTAGGMKTATAALVLATIYSVIRQRNEVEVFRRGIAPDIIRRAVTVGALYLALVGIITLLLCVAMRTGHAFIDLFFEACSACGTVGLSTGVTGGLNVFGKMVTVAGMFIGRVGPLTLLLALAGKARPAEYVYPRENVVIG